MTVAGSDRFAASTDDRGWLGRRLAPAALLVLLFGQLLLFGAEQPRLAILAAIAQLVMAAVMLVVLPAPRLPSGLIATPFACVLLTGLLQLFPLSRLANPAWSFAGAPAIVSLDPWATRVELLKLVGLAGLFVTAMQIGRDDRWRPAFLKGLVIAAAVYGVWAILDRLISPQTFLGLARGDSVRLTGSLLSANSAGSLFGVYAVLAVSALGQALARSHRRPADRIAALAPPVALFVISVVCLLQTASRAAGVATLAGLLVVVSLLAWDRSRRDKISGAAAAVVLGVLGLAVVLYAVSGQTVTDRMNDLHSAINDRGQLYTAYWRAFQDAPALGYGLGAFHQINSQVTPPSNPLTFAVVGSAHNVYLQWLLDGGLSAAAPMGLTVLAIALHCAAGFVAQRRARPYVLAALGALLVLALHGLTDFALQIPAISALLTTLLGIGYGLTTRRG